MTREGLLFAKRKVIKSMKKKVVYLLMLVSLIVSASCGKRLALNPNAPISYVDFTGILYLSSFQPHDGSIDVPVSTSISVTFSADIDSASVSISSFVVADPMFIPVDGTYSYPNFPDTRTVVFTPTAPFLNLTEYNVLLTQDLTDIEGNRLRSEKIWYFTTISAGTIQDPVFTPVCGMYEGPQVVSITCLDPGAIIRYTTDGITDPSPFVGTVYTAPLAINFNTPFPIKAMAYRAGFTNSSISQAWYTIRSITPTVVPPAGAYSSDVLVSLSTPTPGATIKYTLDLSDPETNPLASVYTGPFSIDGPGLITLKAVAISPNIFLLANSPPITAAYTINYADVAPPVFNPAPGSYSNEPSVTFSSPTAGSQIIYTAVAGLDGSDPKEFGIDGGHEVSLNITETTTITAYAYDPSSFLGDSLVITGTYLILPVIYAMNPNKGPNYQPISVTITGTHFKPGVDVRLIRNLQTDIVATSVVLSGHTSITCTLDIFGRAKGKWSLVVTNTDAGTTEKNEFRIY